MHSFTDSAINSQTLSNEMFKISVSFPAKTKTFERDT